MIYLVDCSLYSTSSINDNQSHLNNSSLSKFISPELIVSMNVPENASVDYLQIEKLVMSTLNNNNNNNCSKNIDNDNGNVYLNRFKQDHSNTYRKVQLEPLLSSTQLITNNNDSLKKYTQEDSRQHHSLPSYKRTFHHDNNDNNACSPSSVIQNNNNDDDDLLMIPSTKSFKWTPLNNSIDIDDNTTTTTDINTTDNQIFNNNNNNINMNKPLWNKHLSSNSFNISNNDLSMSMDTFNNTIQTIQYSMDNKDKNNNDDDIFTFGFNMLMTNSENILKKQLKSEDFEIDL